MEPLEWQKMSMKRNIEVKQRIQTIVIYEEVNEDESSSHHTATVQKEAVVESYDRPVQAQYT